MIASETLTPLGGSRVSVSWTHVLGKYAWIFVNGKLTEGPLDFDAAGAVSVTLSVPNPCRIEVHETEPDEAPEAITPALIQRLKLWWSPRADALRYALYRKANANAAEYALGTVAYDPDAGHFEFSSNQDFRATSGPAWNFFRAEAVSARGRASARAPWPAFVRGLPPAPSGVAISGAAGVFSFALEGV